MEKKDQGKRMDPKTFCLKVIKSCQEEANSSPTSGSSFTEAGEAWTSTKTGGAWSSSGAAGRGSWASSEHHVPPAWPSRTPCKSSHKNQGQSRG